MNNPLQCDSPLAQARAPLAALVHDSWLPESYAFAAMEFRAFAEMLEREGLALNYAQRRELKTLVGFYEKKSLTQ